MVLESVLELATDVLTLPAGFKALCATPDEYVQPTGLSSLDFFGELFIGTYNSGKQMLIESSHRNLRDMRHHDPNRRDGSWRIEHASRDSVSSWTAKLDNVTYTFDGQSCGITATDDRDTLKVTFQPTTTRFCIAHFELK